MELLRSHVFGNPHSTNRLALSNWHLDSVPLSFSKIFGYPTGVGCLLAHKAALAKLRRPWYAGGTITLSSIIAANMLERREEGEFTNE
jgi:selenocysteine lyase/cysteine desulfurase